MFGTIIKLQIYEKKKLLILKFDFSFYILTINSTYLENEKITVESVVAHKMFNKLNV